MGHCRRPCRRPSGQDRTTPTDAAQRRRDNEWQRRGPVMAVGVAVPVTLPGGLTGTVQEGLPGAMRRPGKVGTVATR